MLLCAAMLQPDRCAALSCLEQPCDTYTEILGHDAAEPRKLSRSARRVQRATRAALRLRCLSCPPGLDFEFQNESPINDLAKRVDRIETLLFRLPLTEFEKLDSHISLVIDAAKSETVPQEAQAHCEVYDISDEGQRLWKDTCILDLRTDLLNLEARYTACEANLASLTAPHDDIAECIHVLRKLTTRHDCDKQELASQSSCLVSGPEISGKFDGARTAESNEAARFMDHSECSDCIIVEGLARAGVDDTVRLGGTLIDDVASEVSTCLCASGIVADSSERSDSGHEDKAEKGLEKGVEASLGVEIGTNMAPPCMTSIDGSSLARSVVDGTADSRNRQAGWAPEKKQQVLEFVQQVKGILALSVTLNGDADEMVFRYRTKIEAAGGDVEVFDRAVAIARPMVKQTPPPPKKKKSRRR